MGKTVAAKKAARRGLIKRQRSTGEKQQIEMMQEPRDWRLWETWNERAVRERVMPKQKRETKKMEQMISQDHNAQDDKDRLIEMMTEALELCLECDGLTFSAEQAADVCLRRAKGN